MPLWNGAEDGSIEDPVPAYWAVTACCYLAGFVGIDWLVVSSLAWLPAARDTDGLFELCTIAEETDTRAEDKENWIGTVFRARDLEPPDEMGAVIVAVAAIVRGRTYGRTDLELARYLAWFAGHDSPVLLGVVGGVIMALDDLDDGILQDPARTLRKHLDAALPHLRE